MASRERHEALHHFSLSPTGVQVCADGSSFAVINQKGIDPASLDLLAKEGILALR